MGKIFIKTTKKLTALGLALVLLFNISGEVFAYTLTAREKIIEQRDLSSQITSILETAKTEIYSGEKDYKECVEKGVSSSCLRYINNLKRILSDSESKIEGNNSVVESKKTYKEYEQEVKQAIEKEYKRAEEEIEKEIREALWYSDLSWESVNHLNYLKKQNLEELKAWKENEEKNIKSGYGKYEKDYQVWQNKTQTSLEAQGRSYLRKMASNLIAIYEGNKGSEFNDDIIEILSALLNSEEKAGDFVENRLKAEEILLKGLQGDPCAYNAQGKQLNKTGELLTNLALINRNIYSSGATPVVLNEGAWDIIPATYKNPQKCQNAFYALEGLSHLKRSEKGIKVILDFIKKNEKGLAASDKFNNSLVSSSAVLLKWKAYPQLKKYIAAKMQEEKNNEQTGFGAIAGKVAYNGNYLGQISMYNQREDGGNAWEDLAELLAEEGSFESKEILKSSVNSCKIEKEVIGRDKLECQTIMPFLYGALLHAPKVMDSARPYQEPIPQNKEYFDENGRIRQVDTEGIKRRNAYIEQTFREKMKTYGTTLSSGLAGFLYNIKFEDIPTDVKMFLDNRLAKVYSNIAPYNKNSERYYKLEKNRAVATIFKYYGTLFDIWCFVSMAGLGVKSLAGVSALTKAKRVLKGTQALSITQRANILRQVAFIREGYKLRRFGRNFTTGLVNSANIGRKINASAYLAQKQGMSLINYMLHNIAYQRGKNIVLKKNILLVEGSQDFFKSSYYIPGVHKDIFRVSRDVRRAGRLGVRELGAGGQVVSYVDKAKLKIFKEYTQDYIKGQEVGKEALSGATRAKYDNVLPLSKNNLLPREYLYSAKYKKILPYLQDKEFSQVFNIGDKLYEGLRGKGLYVINTKTGKVFNDFSFNFEGYLKKNNMLGGLITPLKNTAKTQNAAKTTAIFNTQNYLHSILEPKTTLILPKNILNNSLRIANPAILFVPALPKTSLYFGKVLFDKNIKPRILNRDFLESEEITFIPGEDLPEIKGYYDYDFDSSRPLLISWKLDNLRKQMLAYGRASKLNEEESLKYNNILKDIYNIDVAKAFSTPDIIVEQVKKLSEEVSFFVGETPLLTFQGNDITLVTPNNLKGDIILYDLSKIDNYKDFIAKKVKELSSFKREYTIYLLMHGNKKASLSVSENQDTSLEEILNIIYENKGEEVINVISSSCHSGAALKNPGSLVKKGINVLLLSGRNDLCKTSDVEFVKINDLRATYMKALKERYYGAYLIYEGKFFNPLVDANLYLKEGDIRKEEIKLLRQIYFKEDLVGKPIYQLLLEFPNHYTSSLFPFEKLKEISYMPFVFNPVYTLQEIVEDFIFLRDPRNHIWEYVLNTYRIGHIKSLQSSKVVPIREVNDELHKFLLESAKAELEREFPGYIYKEPPIKWFDNAPLYPYSDEDFLGKNFFDFQKQKSAPFIKNPKTFTKFFIKYGIEEKLAKRLANACFEGKNKKYNPVIFEKVKYLLQEGVEPKYIDNMIAALSVRGEFSLELFDKAMLLYKEYGQPLPISAYLTNLCVRLGDLEETKFLKLKNLLKDNFDFSKLVDFNMGRLIEASAQRDLNQAEEAFLVFGNEISDILSSFAKGEGKFDKESWNNFMYLLKEEHEYNFASLSSYLHLYLLDKKTIENAIDILGLEDTSQTMKLNKKRYLKVFKVLYKIFNEEELALLKEQIEPLELDKKLEILNTLASSVNRVSRDLDTNKKKDLIKTISTPKEFKKEINKLVFKQLLFDYKEELGNIFDFSSNKYINFILEAPYHFYINLSLLYETIKDNLGKPIKQIFDELPENQAFAKMCKERGINYEAWRSYDPKSFITRNVLINGGKEPQERMRLTIRKVDMDNISKALTTGNESSSCRSVGKGNCGHLAPNLIRNKMVQQVEILAGGKAVGNALVYLGEVEGRTSIIVGSFVKREPYFSYEVTELMLDYVRKIRSEITKEKIPIYFSNYLRFDNRYKYPLGNYEVMLLGDGYNDIFVSFTHDTIMPYTQKKFRADLFLIEKGEKQIISKENILSFYNSKNIDRKTARELVDSCFQWEKGVFNEAIFKTQKDLLEREVEPRFILGIIENLSPEGKFIPELYDKVLELSEIYKDSIFHTTDIMKYCVEKGAFSPKIYEKIKLLYENKINCVKSSLLRNCVVNGEFKEELFNKGLSLSREYGSITPQIIQEFSTKEGKFKEEDFKNFLSLIEQTKNHFVSSREALKVELVFAEPYQKAFALLGTKEVINLVSANRERYANTFEELFEILDEKNAALLKEKIATLPLEKKVGIITMLAGAINENKIKLNNNEIRKLIHKITPETKEFKEHINRLVFKQLGLKYTPKMAKIFDFSSNKYISLIMKSSNNFNAHLKELFEALALNIEKGLTESFDALAENQAFAKICAENGVNYQAWRGYNPNSFIARQVLLNKEEEPKIREEIIVQKVDMDNVIKALTSGNESGACRSVGHGMCKDAAPELVRNKMVQQVEILHKGKVVGNVLIYLAKVNGKLAIVMGSIIRKERNYVSKEINELVIDYIRQIRQDIERPDIPIYMSSYLKVENYYPMNWDNVVLLGAGENKIFNSFTHKFEVPSKNIENRVLLYQVDEGLKGQGDYVNTAYPGANNVSSNNSLLPVNFNFLDKLKFLTSPVFKIKVFKGPEAIQKRATGFYIKYRNFPFILTVGHLFKDADLNNIRVYNNLGFSEKAELLSISDKSDLAVLALPQGVLDRFTPWTLSLKEPRVGDDLLSIGYPKAKIKKTSKVELLSRDMYLTSPERNGSVFYQHEQGKFYLGASGSPLSNIATPKELVGVSCAVNEKAHKAISVPLPQIRTFLGETIKKILFTPELSSKFLPLYPAFAKNYENVVNKFIYPSELAKKPSEKVKGTLTKKEQSIRLKRRIPEYFLTSPGYFRGMELNSLEELETILKEGLPVSKTSFDGIYFTPDIGLAFIYADNNGVKERISVLLKNINYKELTPINPPAEYASTRDVLPEEIGDVIVWTTIDGKEGWYKAILDEDNKIALLHSDEVQTQVPTQEQQVETSWLAKLKTKIAAKRTAAYNKNPENKAEFYLKEAKAAYEKENLDLAEDYYKLAIAQDPNNAKYYHELGRFYDDVYIDKYYQNLALENYNKAISLDPKNGEYYYSRALLKQYLLKDTPGAINDLAMSMKYGMKGFHTESLFKEWTEDYIKSQKSSQSQTLKPNFEPTAMETDYIPTSYTGANTEKPLNLKTDIKNGGNSLIANEDILYELSYEDYKGTPTLPDIERRIGSRLYRTAAKYKLKLNESDVIWIENNISKNSKHRDLFWLIDSTEPKNRNIETLNYIATFFNQFIDMPDIPRNVNKVLIALSGEYWAWYKKWVKDFGSRNFLIERWLEKAYTDKGIVPDNPEF